MALIKCPECGKEISDQAEFCIHCGYPIKKDLDKQSKIEQGNETNVNDSMNTNADSERQYSNGNADEKRKLIRNRVIAVVVVVGIIIVLIAAFEYSQHSFTRAQNRARQSYSNYQNEKSELDSLQREKAAVDATIDAVESGR